MPLIKKKQAIYYFEKKPEKKKERGHFMSINFIQS